MDSGKEVRSMKRRITAMLIVLAMLFGMMPGTAYGLPINDFSCLKGLVDGKAVLGSQLSFDIEELAGLPGNEQLMEAYLSGIDFMFTESKDPESYSFDCELSVVDNKVKWSVPDKYYLAGEGFYIGLCFDNGATFFSKTITAVVKMSDIPIAPLPSKTYTGSPHKPDCSKIVHGEVEFREGEDYTVSYKNNTNAGTASVVFTGKGRVIGSATKTFEISKIPNTMTAQGNTVKIKASKLKKKKQIIKPTKSLRICNAVGNLNFKLAGVNKKKFKKYFKVNANNGNITIKKGLRKGTYKLKIDITAAGDANHMDAMNRITVTVRVK